MRQKLSIGKVWFVPVGIWGQPQVHTSLLVWIPTDDFSSNSTRAQYVAPDPNLPVRRWQHLVSSGPGCTHAGGWADPRIIESCAQNCGEKGPLILCWIWDRACVDQSDFLSTVHFHPWRRFFSRLLQSRDLPRTRDQCFRTNGTGVKPGWA